LFMIPKLFEALSRMWSMSSRIGERLIVVCCLFVCLVPVHASQHAEKGRANWMNQAINLERQGNWEALAETGSRWTHAEPTNATAWFVLGRALGAQGRYPEAISAYRKSLALHPGDVYALNNLGNLFRDSRRDQEAMETYRAALRINPGYMAAWQNLGTTFYQMKGTPGVARALQQLNAVDPVLARVWYALAISYGQTRDPGLATEAVGILRGLSPAQREQMFHILLSGS
jgi:tetratricopeptide (TPR) repeat protein